MQSLKEKNTDISKAKSKEKKLNSLEEELKLKNRDLASLKMKSTIFNTVLMIGSFWFLNSKFSGLVVAKIPFEPIPLIRGISHRNIEGEDFTDCSVTFLYALCSMSIRTNIQKLFGNEKSSQNAGLSGLLNSFEQNAKYNKIR